MHLSLNVRVGTRKRRSSAARSAAYTARSGKYAGRKGEHLLAVCVGNMPSWVTNSRGKRARSAGMGYWHAVDMRERSNGVLYRKIVVALPEVLSVERKIELSKELTEAVTSVPGGHLPYLFAIHSKQSASPNVHANTHCHIMFSERINDGIERSEAGWFRLVARRGSSDLAGAKKARIWEQGVAWLLQLRATYAELANRYLKEDGHEPNVCTKSFAELGIDREPTKHVGWGKFSEKRRELNLKITELNDDRKQLNEMYEKLNQLRLEEALSEVAMEDYATDEDQDGFDDSCLMETDLPDGAEEDHSDEDVDSVECTDAAQSVPDDSEKSGRESENAHQADGDFDLDDFDFVTDAS